jgi:hypothetical protein
MNENGEFATYEKSGGLRKIRDTLNERGDNVIYNLVVVPFEQLNVSQTSSEEKLGEATPLIDRLLQHENSNKKLLNPTVDNFEKRPRALTLNELNKLISDDKYDYHCNFIEGDTLYICGHSNQTILGSMSPEALAEKLAEFLKATGIKNIKLAGCHTGERILPEDIMEKVENGDKQEKMLEALTNSYAQKFSEQLEINGVHDVNVYGYIGGHVERTENNSNRSQKKKTMGGGNIHSYAINTNEYGDDNETRVRMEDARVCYVNGEMVSGPKAREEQLSTHQNVKVGEEVIALRTSFR